MTDFGHGISIVIIKGRPVIKSHNTYLSIETAFEHKLALEKAIIELNKLTSNQPQRK